MLLAMKLAEIFHRVIFVTKMHDGVQIGYKGFEGYLKAARSAILHKPFLEGKNVTHVPWTEHECTLFEVKEGDNKGNLLPSIVFDNPE